MLKGCSLGDWVCVLRRRVVMLSIGKMTERYLLPALPNAGNT